MGSLKKYPTIGIQIIIIFLLFLTGNCRKSNVIIEKKVTIQDNCSGTGTITWTKNKEYILDGFVFVNDGQILTIERGTVIRAKTGQAVNASALIVARGGKIIAEGTREEPIIFTIEGDDLKGSVPVLSRGLWGGLIILGNARLNTSANEAFIEGIPRSEPRGIYGGTIDNDNSGVIRYVSIRHGGTNIGEGNEINGLTLGGVGNGTIIDHVEIISNADDGIEFFGGTVNCRNIIVAFCEDDAFDFDDGYRGKGQFWLAIQDPSIGDKIGEHDGGTDPVTGLPYSIPVIYNATCIGRGPGKSSSLLIFRNNSGGKYVNSIFIEQENGVEIEYTEFPQDSYKQFELGNLEIRNNIFYEITDGTPEMIFKVVAEQGIDVTSQLSVFQLYFTQAGNEIFDPGITISTDYYNIFPTGDITTNLAPYDDPWFHPVLYKGAFGSENWADGWTLLSQAGYI